MVPCGVFNTVNPKRVLEYYARRCLAIRLGLYQHYPAKPLAIPEWYHQPVALRQPLPKVTIVTPAYQHGHFLERTIKSVLSQHYAALEYVVQDGGSTDQTGEIIDRYRSQLFRGVSQRDRGQTHAINLGFAETTGEIMAYLNSDDLLLPEAINTVVNYFQQHPEVDVVYGHRVCVNSDDQEIGRWVLPPHSNQMLLWADYVPQETLFWRRRIWNRVGGCVDESFQFAMDWDLLLRFRRVYAKMVRLPRFLGGFRIHDAQKSQAQIEHIGEQEMTRLRTREHGRVVSRRDIYRGIMGYLLQHAIYDKLYRYGCIQY